MFYFTFTYLVVFIITLYLLLDLFGFVVCGFVGLFAGLWLLLDGPGVGLGVC